MACDMDSSILGLAIQESRYHCCVLSRCARGCPSCRLVTSFLLFEAHRSLMMYKYFSTDFGHDVLSIYIYIWFHSLQSICDDIYVLLCSFT